MPLVVDGCQRLLLEMPRRKLIDFHVEPPEGWELVMLNRWPIGKLCARVALIRLQYTLVNVTGTSWNDQPPPRNPYKRKR
jgi:hypothetical protein